MAHGDVDHGEGVGAPVGVEGDERQEHEEGEVRLDQPTGEVHEHAGHDEEPEAREQLRREAVGGHEEDGTRQRQDGELERCVEGAVAAEPGGEPDHGHDQRRDRVAQHDDTVSEVPLLLVVGIGGRDALTEKGGDSGAIDLHGRPVGRDHAGISDAPHDRKKQPILGPRRRGSFREWEETGDPAPT